MEELRRQLAASEEETSLLNIVGEEVRRLSDDNAALRARVKGLEAKTIKYAGVLSAISWQVTEWNANKLGGVSIQRKRWQKMGNLARAALEGES